MNEFGLERVQRHPLCYADVDWIQQRVVNLFGLCRLIEEASTLSPYPSRPNPKPSGKKEQAEAEEEEAVGVQ